MNGTAGRNYLANHQIAPQLLQGTPSYNVEVGNGQVPAGEFYPAQYLPVIQSENRLAGSGYVLMPGKVVCLDEDSRIVPAGLVAEVKNARSVAGYTTAPTSPTTYGQLSQDNGVLLKNGLFADAADEFVTANTFFSGAMSAFGFGMPVGIMRYSKLMTPGSDPSNPATFTKHGYDTGGGAAFSRWCQIQVPVIETSARTEVMPEGETTFRITVYPNASGLAFTGFAPAKKALPQMMTAPVATVADQYALLGRTIMFNGPLPAGTAVVYTPEIKTPFTSLVVTSVTGANQLQNGIVSYDFNSNFVLSGSAIAPHLIGSIIDVKQGQNDDLKLVRSYFRDFGLWQEQPGSATDGRNTQLSIANAPRWIARIVVNFETLYQTYTA